MAVLSPSPVRPVSQPIPSIHIDAAEPCATTLHQQRSASSSSPPNTNILVTRATLPPLPTYILEDPAPMEPSRRALSFSLDFAPLDPDSEAAQLAATLGIPGDLARPTMSSPYANGYLGYTLPMRHSQATLNAESLITGVSSDSMFSEDQLHGRVATPLTQPALLFFGSPPSQGPPNTVERHVEKISIWAEEVCDETAKCPTVPLPIDNELKRFGRKLFSSKSNYRAGKEHPGPRVTDETSPDYEKCFGVKHLLGRAKDHVGSLYKPHPSVGKPPRTDRYGAHPPSSEAEEDFRNTVEINGDGNLSPRSIRCDYNDSMKKQTSPVFTFAEIVRLGPDTPSIGHLERFQIRGFAHTPVPEDIRTEKPPAPIQTETIAALDWSQMPAALEIVSEALQRDENSRNQSPLGADGVQDSGLAKSRYALHLCPSSTPLPPSPSDESSLPN